MTLQWLRRFPRCPHVIWSVTRTQDTWPLLTAGAALKKNAQMQVSWAVLTFSS